MSHKSQQQKVEDNLQKGHLGEFNITTNPLQANSYANDLIKARSSGDPTHGGKLVPVHIINKLGHHQLVYKTPEEAKALIEGDEHAHATELKPGHRIHDPKHGKGTIKSVKGHDGKGHVINVHFDNGHKAGRYAHNVDHLNPLDETAEVKTAPKQSTANNTAKAPNKPTTANIDEDDFDEDMLSPKERMEEWEQMVYKLVTPGKGVNAALAYGKGGVGKTYRLQKMLDGVKVKGKSLVEGQDYVTFTGGTTASGLYEMLYNHNGKLIVLDDFDDVFSDSDAVNILKGAVDTSKKRVVTRAKAGGGGEDDIPNRFEFTGKVAFISNLDLDRLAEKNKDVEALLTRADGINLRMTNSQTVDLIESDILFSKGFGFKNAFGKKLATTDEEKKEVFDFVKSNMHNLSELSVRTMGKVNAIRKFYTDKGQDWKPVAEAMLVEGKQDVLDVNQRFDAYADFVEILAKGGVKSAIAYGRGGIGKTYTAVERLHDMGMIDADEADSDTPLEDQFIHYQGGKFSAKGLYDTLYHHNGKLIVIDDADTALTNKQAQNILKGALDTSGSGKVNWIVSESSKKKMKAPKKEKGESKEDFIARMIEDGTFDENGQMIDTNVPNEFTFTGRVLFISNLDKEKLAQPLQSRALTVNTTMTRPESLQRMNFVAEKKIKDGQYRSDNIEGATGKDVKEAMAFFESLSDRIPDRHFNNRTLDKIIGDKIHAESLGKDWKKVIKTKLLKGNEYGALNNIQDVNLFKSFNVLLFNSEDSPRETKTPQKVDKLTKAFNSLLK